MRKLTGCLLALSALGLGACEDGPTQVFDPSPEGAGDRWNDGKTGGTVDPGKAGFDGDFGGGSKQEICTGNEKAKRWSKMINEDIKPPRFMAGLDFAGSDNWEGLDFELAEKTLCQADNQGADDAGSFYSSWGDAGEVLVGYDINNHKVNFVQLNAGYKGTIKFESRPGTRFSADKIHKYEMGIGRQILRDGQPFQLNWEDSVKVAEEGTELYDAMMWTFAPELPSDTVNCRKSAKCRLAPDGAGGGGFGARGVGFYIHIPSLTKPQPVPSTPDYMYVFVVKQLPFSGAAMTLKLDQEGPTATAGLLGDRTPQADCKFKLGTKYADFKNNCVAVLADPKKNTTALNKFLGGHTHNDESYIFNVVGVNVDFGAANLPPLDIIHDDWAPADNDVVSEYILDIRANGPVTNDNNAAGVVDLHGTGVIYREYARLVQEDLQRLLPAGTPKRTIGDPACLFPDPLPAGFDPYSWVAPAGCTGLEGMLTPAKADTGNPNIDKLSIGAAAQNLGYTTVLRPGDPAIAFCNDPSETNPAGFSYCGGPADPVGLQDTVWEGSFRRVLQVLGRGNINILPAEARDRRYYFKIWAEAYVKYLRAAHLNPTDLSKPEFDVWAADPESLFFDPVGRGNERWEYIDRTYVAEGRLPLDIEYQALIQSGNQQYINYRMRFDRPEKTLYSAMRVNKQSPIGKEDNVRFSNVIGSPVLRDGYYATDIDGKDALFCATHLDDDCLSVDPKNKPPTKKDGTMELDSKGRPILSQYPGAFGETAFTLGTTHLKIAQTFPNIQNAKVQVPSFLNPYDPTSPATVLEVLTDWKPKQPQEGFPIPINGTRSKFYSAASLDFTGESITFRFDYEAVPNSQNIRLLAVETTDYLGEVFLCKDPATGDLLHAKMYDPVGGIIDWLQAHPGTYQSCGIIIQYSPFNNYPDFVVALPVGVSLEVNSGSGFGRVSNVQTWVPGL